jgi:hypothetical protein
MQWARGHPYGWRAALRTISMALKSRSDLTTCRTPLQWWIAPHAIWRIKTYAADHDIHVYSIGTVNSDSVVFAQANNRKHYGDVIQAEHVLTFEDCTDVDAVARVLGAASLPSHLEVSADRLHSGNRTMRSTGHNQGRNRGRRTRWPTPQVRGWRSPMSVPEDDRRGRIQA